MTPGKKTAVCLLLDNKCFKKKQDLGLLITLFNLICHVSASNESLNSDRPIIHSFPYMHLIKITEKYFQHSYFS